MFAVPPRIDRNSFESPLKLKAGQDIVLEVKFIGEPEPVVTWTKDNEVSISSVLL